MEILTTIVLMVVIGAIVGGVTNYLAIKMLFKPYKAIYIGKWRLPFTPGLIPKRRDEMAVQMGNLVVNHLLTAESIKLKLMNPIFQKEITGLVQTELSNVLDSEKSVNHLLDKWGISDGQKKTESYLNDWLERKYDELMETYRYQPIKNVLSPEIIAKGEEKIPVISKMIIQKGVDYFSSDEGKMRIQRMADDFVQGRSGMLRNMLQMFLGNVNLAEKIQPELIKFLNNEGTEEIITTLLMKEWHKLLEKETSLIEEQFDKEKIMRIIKSFFNNVASVPSVFNASISSLTVKFRPYLIDELAPSSVKMLTEWAAEKVEGLMKKLKLSEIVRDQVSSFSFERLEEMVFSIIRSELKMITFLGAFLGGLIGIIQGVLAVWIL
ncbi:uncharacterized membrane protein YheB (UPF0754 family) [Cytobacillus horneckiae]|uniref:DUF445 domain-containing protein n=1 Tax=Cytobacillus horneckiae TaxID=549687 RepID=A0A2N0ZF20_9BACI|nr:DUF445 family protein [Cytobacillus horneckiae]MBN6887669.1 DUF445 domain-containing protein [Cytobacillus horneckiae]MCM3178726.1 DUF445 family protein [Cytobacillus horneckiae]MEC1158202.1 DUF445 family protein [Cytobacillus horneckiae]MED2940154.1 DUF445 family protein [Cytobacillus horneckiae]PKG28104.1 DUF445 domain-containing protein [Cytobacillus horneckiae]